MPVLMPALRPVVRAVVANALTLGGIVVAAGSSRGRGRVPRGPGAHALVCVVESAPEVGDEVGREGLLPLPCVQHVLELCPVALRHLQPWRRTPKYHITTIKARGGGSTHGEHAPRRRAVGGDSRHGSSMHATKQARHNGRTRTYCSGNMAGTTVENSET